MTDIYLSSPVQPKPVGFAVPYQFEVAEEFKAAQKHDKGQLNVHFEDSSSKNTRGFTSYRVSEEVISVADQNTSVQQVTFMRNNIGNTGSASLFSIDFYNHRSADITAKDDGTVLYSESGDFKNIDITKAAARAGITAAGIRRTQQDIAADGEVDRKEQQQIINLITQAKGLAGFSK